MKIVQSTWVRYHHFDLARELHQMGCLERVFTSLPWWKADKESKEQNIPREFISCNFLIEGMRRIGKKLPGYNRAFDDILGVIQTKLYSHWVANNLPECDAYIGISGSGLQAGRVAKSRGAGYIMDRGSSNIRFVNDILQIEYKRWNIPWTPIHPWLIENEKNEELESNLITVPSKFAKQTFIKQGTDPNKLRVIPYGVSLKDFYRTDNPPDNCFRLIFVGQLSIRKGAMYLLEAFQNFPHPNKELIIIGSIEYEIQSLIKNNIKNNIKFLGSMPRANIKSYMSVSHALVLPSVEDGFGMVLNQAAACGCPLIASTNTGFSTIFEHEKHGLMIEACNSKALRDAFIRLADEPQLRESMSENCLSRVNNLNGWKMYAEEMLLISKEAREISRKCFV